MRSSADDGPLMSDRPFILVNGARGHLGRAVVAQLGDAHVIIGTRRLDEVRRGAIFIDSDGYVDPAALLHVGAIINCAGQVTGEEAQVTQANVDHPLSLARIAKAAGVARFVQVSSFSVYGHAQSIDGTTPIAPANHYGITKRAAEDALLSLADADFSVICVRLPFMFGADNPALMGSLIGGLRGLPVLPVAAEPVRRSMLTYGDAALALVDAAQAQRGVVSAVQCAADPIAFRFDMLARLMREAGLRPARLVPVPSLVSRAVVAIAPGVGRRLFASSVLDPASNSLSSRSLVRGIEAEIRSILKTV
jgi:nucleoside-diphosphate-sugar epimerase